MTCPPSVYASDTALAGLNTAELLLIAALRLWSLPHREPDGAHPDWRGGLEAAGIDESGREGFDALFTAFILAPQRALDVRCQNCPSLGEDEARFVQLVSLLQRHQAEGAVAILADWMAPMFVQVGMRGASNLAASLARARLVVPLRHAEAAAIHQIAAGHSDRGLALVQ